MDYQKIRAIVTMIISFSGVALNSLGIYVLIKTKQFALSKQMIVLKNIAVVDIINSLMWVWKEASTLIGKKYSATHQQILNVIFRGTVCVWFLLFYTLNIDRFIGVNFPLKHRALASKRVYILVIVIIWSCGGFSSLISYFFDADILDCKHQYYIWLAMDAIFLGIFVATYTTTYWQVSRPKVGNGRRRPNNKLALMITYMLVAILLTNVLPDLGFIIMCQLSKCEWEREVVGFLLKIILLVDPLIYILTIPDAKKIIKERFCRMAQCLPISNRQAACNRVEIKRV